MPRPTDHTRARQRRTRPALAAAAAAAVVVLVTAGCSGSSKSATSTTKKTTTTKVGKGQVALTVSVPGVESAGQPANIPDDVKATISESVNTYVQGATVQPMQTGQPAADITAMFTAGAAARLATDLPVFIDSGLPAASGPVAAKTATLTLTGLAQQDGSVVLVDAALALDVGAKTQGGTESVQRVADLVYSNDNGTWKIASYDVHVTRTVPGADPSTTTAVTPK
ncbi:MAG: hypothetical protein JWL73_1010 [Actinomycetia bacterium]|nr:hypothetical protein [Actinomycetes bacterium]